MDALSLIIGFIIGHWTGWHRAHEVIAKECERLGAFYVGRKTYQCNAIDEDKRT